MTTTYATRQDNTLVIHYRLRANLYRFTHDSGMHPRMTQAQHSSKRWASGIARMNTARMNTKAKRNNHANANKLQ